MNTLSHLKLKALWNLYYVKFVLSFLKNVETKLAIYRRKHLCVKSVQIRSFFWSAFSRIWTKYGEIIRISPYSVRMRKNTDQKKLLIWTLFTQCIFDVDNWKKPFFDYKIQVKVYSLHKKVSCGFVHIYWRNP